MSRWVNLNSITGLSDTPVEPHHYYVMWLPSDAEMEWFNLYPRMLYDIWHPCWCVLSPVWNWVSWFEGHAHSSNSSVVGCACHSMNLHQHTVGTSDLTSCDHSTPNTCSGLLTVPQTHQAFPWLKDFVLPGLHSEMFFILITAEFMPSFPLSLLKYLLSLEAVSNDSVFFF